MNAVRIFLFGTLMGATALVYACVGDDPGSDTVSAPDSGQTDGNGSSSGSSGSPTDTGTPDSNGTACDGGITCDGVCVDVTGDSKNCGRCAHPCGGTAKCTDSKCEAVLIDGDPMADGGAPITSLVTDQPADNPQAIATQVFWAQAGASGGVFQDSIAGGNQIKLSTTPTALTTTIAINQTDVYWSLANAGGPPQPVVKGTVGAAGSQTGYTGLYDGPTIVSLTYDATAKYVVGSYEKSGSQWGAFRCGKLVDGGLGCTSLTTFNGQTGGNVANDGTNIYVADVSNGFIERVALNGGSVGSYILGQSSPDTLRVDGTHLYWGDSVAKTIQRDNLGSSTTPKQMTSTDNAPDAIAADAKNVYWTETETGTLNFAPVTGQGPKTAYVAKGASSQPMRLVRDTGNLFFTHNGAIYRIALP